MPPKQLTCFTLSFLFKKKKSPSVQLFWLIHQIFYQSNLSISFRKLTSSALKNTHAPAWCFSWWDHPKPERHIPTAPETARSVVPPGPNIREAPRDHPQSSVPGGRKIPKVKGFLFWSEKCRSFGCSWKLRLRTCTHFTFRSGFCIHCHSTGCSRKRLRNCCFCSGFECLIQNLSLCFCDILEKIRHSMHVDRSKTPLALPPWLKQQKLPPTKPTGNKQKSTKTNSLN